MNLKAILKKRAARAVILFTGYLWFLGLVITWPAHGFSLFSFMMIILICTSIVAFVTLVGYGIYWVANGED